MNASDCQLLSGKRVYCEKNIYLVTLLYLTSIILENIIINMHDNTV